MQAHYGLDLRQVCYGSQRVGVRRLHALLHGLPKDSALFRELDPNKGWSQTDELLASLVQVVDAGNRQFIAANVQSRAQIPAPIKIRRPWEEETKPRTATAEELREAMGARYIGKKVD